MHVCVSNERRGSLPGSQELELCKHDQVTDERLATPHEALLEWQPHGRDRHRLETRGADPLLPTTSAPRIDKPTNRKQQTDSRKGRIGALPEWHDEWTFTSIGQEACSELRRSALRPNSGCVALRGPLGSMPRGCSSRSVSLNVGERSASVCFRPSARTGAAMLGPNISRAGVHREPNFSLTNAISACDATR